MNTKFPLKNAFQQHDSRGVNATKSVHLFTSQPFESRKSRTTRKIAVFWGERMIVVGKRIEKNNKKKKRRMEGNYRRNTKMGKTNRLEKRVKEEKIQCVRQKMAGYLRSYSTLIFSLPVIIG